MLIHEAVANVRKVSLNYALAIIKSDIRHENKNIYELLKQSNELTQGEEISMYTCDTKAKEYVDFCCTLQLEIDSKGIAILLCNERSGKETVFVVSN
mgnify:FL=1